MRIVTPTSVTSFFVLAVIGSCLNYLPAADAFTISSKSTVMRRRRALQLHAVGDISEAVQQSSAVLDSLSATMQHSGFIVADAADQAVSIYSKVDKTGFIGFFATYIEVAIDFFRSIIKSAGIENAYGFSIILFTILVKVVTLPLTTQQLESTSKMQKLTPLQKKIQERFADDESTKNQLLSQLFQAAQVNPLAGCLPALVQIPIFISLYRALTNLVAENKLDESFLWIPDLEGPVYSKPPGESFEWVKSIFSGSPVLGWHDTLCFLSLPLILFVSQTISQQVLKPPQDPNRKMTEQEEVTQGIVNYLPFIVAFFSINVPAGLAVYWIINNVLTTAVTLAVKASIADEPFPEEVQKMMALIDGPPGAAQAAAGAAQRKAAMDLNRPASVVEDRPKVEGFGSTGQPLWNTEQSAASGTVDDAEEFIDVTAIDDSAEEAAAAAAPKRKRRSKPTSQKQKKQK